MSLPEYSNAPHIGPFLSMLPPNARLLVQAGGDDGGLGRKFRSIYPATSWLVVDADPKLTLKARAYADPVHLADLETVGDTFYKQLEWADGWIFDCTFERFRCPGKVLEQVRKVIQYDGCIVFRIANSGYWKQSAESRRNRLAIGDILGLLKDNGFRVVNGVLLIPAPMPQDVADVLRRRAAQTGEKEELLQDDAQASHYLIKAMPA